MSCLPWLVPVLLPRLVLSLSSLLSLNPLEQAGPEVACLDHSDCTQLGHKFGCLIYRCVDHSQAESCQSGPDCPEAWHCLRTGLPGYPSGLCVPQSSLLPCASSPSSPCSCCGQYCCPPSYQSQWADMSCVSDGQCRTWGTGQFCCRDTARCCEHSAQAEDYQYQYDYYNYSDYDYHYTTTYQDNSTDLVENESFVEDIFQELLNETSTESAENDYDINNSSDLFEDIESELLNETSTEDYYSNNNSSELFENTESLLINETLTEDYYQNKSSDLLEAAEDIFSGLGNDTTESEENDYEISNSSDLYSDTELEEEISLDTSYGYKENVGDETADVEIVTIDKTEEDEEQVVKVTTFYETFNKTSTEEKLNFDPTKEKDEPLIEVSEVVPSAVENVAGDDLYFSGSGDFSEDLSVEDLNDEFLTDGLKIENFSLEPDERELSTEVSESSLESSLKYDDGLDKLQDGMRSEFDVDLVLETSGSAENLWLEEENDNDLEGSGSDLHGEIRNISHTSDDSLAETTVAGENLTVIENDLDVTVEDVEVVKKPTNLVGKSTNEVAWKSDAIRKKMSVSLIIIFVILPLNL